LVMAMVIVALARRDGRRVGFLACPDTHGLTAFVRHKHVEPNRTDDDKKPICARSPA